MFWRMPSPSAPSTRAIGPLGSACAKFALASPAKPMRQWVRELTTLSNLAKPKGGAKPQDDAE